MKKLIVSLLFLSTSLIVFAGTWFSLPQINIKPDGCEWSGWQYCKPEPIMMYFEPEIKKMTIYSKEVQIINYSVLEEKKYKDFDTLIGYATDTNYKNIVIQITSFKNGTEFLTISYSDSTYMYVVEETEQ